MSVTIPVIRVRNPSADAIDDGESSHDNLDERERRNGTENDYEGPLSSPTKSTRSATYNRESIDTKQKGVSDGPQSPTKPSPRPGDHSLNNVAIDPLSRHILKRTGTAGQIPQRLKRQDTNENIQANIPENLLSGTKPAAQAIPQVKRSDTPASQKEKKKGFLSRFIGGKKKDVGIKVDDDNDSNAGDPRTEGIDAAVFSQPIGFTPKFPPPPKYIRVRAHHKAVKDFDRLFLAQELYKNPNPVRDARSDNLKNRSSVSLDAVKHRAGAIWSMKFSKDGRYLAVGGQDKIVTVWEVLCSEDDRREHEHDEDAHDDFNGGHDIYSGGRGIRINAPVFRAEPLREYTGHTADILDLSWSKNNFLLSSSMDKTVRLWHISRSECLCAFQHSDFVTSILFHPKDDRFFLAGSLDSKLRLWSIPDKAVAFVVELSDLITAVGFTPDGKYAIAGCLNGLCLFYETEGLRYHTQVHVRSTHGRNARGSKITGIEAMTFPPDDPNGEIKLLITSNDSRIRLYNFRDKSLEAKFRGNENTCSQIHANFSDDTKYVICGSEDRKVYIWDVSAGPGDKKAKIPLEYFEAHSSIVTVAVVAPTVTRQLLGHSRDPIYDLCNPPPVTLISRSESFASSAKYPMNKGPTNDPSAYPGEKTQPQASRPKPEESPAYIARSAHTDGNIIVTADYTGKIKVFRQDCAYLKRKNEAWETSSTFSKKIGTGIFSNGGNRRFSGQAPNPDRILSWRNSISSNLSQESSIKHPRDSVDSRAGSFVSSSGNRSVSPKKSLASISGQSALTASSSMPRITLTDPTGNAPTTTRSRGNSINSLSGRTRMNSKDMPTSPLAKTMSRDPDDVLLQENGQSYAYYNLAAAPATEAGHLNPDGSDRRASMISSEENMSEGFSSESDNEEVKCKSCGGISFKAKKAHRGRSEAKLVCVKCGTPC